MEEVTPESVYEAIYATIPLVGSLYLAGFRNYLVLGTVTGQKFRSTPEIYLTTSNATTTSNSRQYVNSHLNYSTLTVTDCSEPGLSNNTNQYLVYQPSALITASNRLSIDNASLYKRSSSKSSHTETATRTKRSFEA